MDHVDRPLKRWPGRRVYLLTCWLEMADPPAKPAWRFKLETPAARSHRLFHTFEAVAAAIEQDLKDAAVGDG